MREPPARFAGARRGCLRATSPEPDEADCRRDLSAERDGVVGCLGLSAEPGGAVGWRGMSADPDRAVGAQAAGPVGRAHAALALGLHVT